MEDIESNFAQLNILLKKEYIILWVRNGQEAINSFIREKPDLILMDIRMPVMTGLEATVEIRKSEHPDKDIPIIAMTADAFSDDAQHCFECGMDAHIIKPIDIRECKRILSKYLN